MKRNTICIFGIPEREEKEKWTESIHKALLQFTGAQWLSQGPALNCEHYELFFSWNITST